MNQNLLLWEPRSPYKHSTENAETKPARGVDLDAFSMTDSIYVPPSTLADTLLNCDEDGDGYAYESKRCKTEEDSEDKSKKQETDLKTSAFSFEMAISKASIDLLMPLRNADNKVVPHFLGELIVIATNLNIFSVNGFNEIENLAYLVVQSHNMEFYHCTCIPHIENRNCKLRAFDDPIPAYMSSLLYTLPDNLKPGKSPRDDCQGQMFSLATEITKDFIKKEKRLILAAGIDKTALRYHHLSWNQTWLEQVMDFTDATEEHIDNYESFGLVTELHMHLQDCAIDYRPKPSAYRAVVDIGSLFLNCNLSAGSGCPTLRFSPQDCNLLLAQYVSIHIFNILSRIL